MEIQKKLTHSEECFGIVDFTHTLLHHFDLLMDHIKHHFDQDFVSNIYVSKEIFKKFDFRTDEIDKLYWGILWVYNEATDKHFSHYSNQYRTGDHFCRELTLFVKDEETQKEIKAYFRFWALDVFKGKGKDIRLYELR